MSRTVYVDLRNRRRITLNEAKFLLRALDHTGCYGTVERKLREAIELAEHACPEQGQCPTCGKWPGTAKALREKRAADMDRRMRDAMESARWVPDGPRYPGGAA